MVEIKDSSKMGFSGILGDYLQDDKACYFKFPIGSKHVKSWYSPKVKANVRARKVGRITAKRGMF